MNDDGRREWGSAVRGCAALLALALAALLTQTGIVAWSTMRAAATQADEPDILELPAAARHLARLGHTALDGTPVAVEFAQTRNQVAAHVQQLMAQMAATPHLQTDANTLISTWAEMDTAAGQLHGNLNALEEIAARYAQCLDLIAPFKTQLDALVREMVASGSTASQTYLALHQVVLADEMARHAGTIRTGGDSAALEAMELTHNITVFDRVLAGLRHGDAEMALHRLQGNKTLAALAQVEAQWKTLRPLLNAIAQQASVQLAAYSALATLEHGADTLLASASSLPQPPIHVLLKIAPWTGFTAAILALLSSVGLWQALLRRRRHWHEQAAQLRHREQDAFAQLLDEMGALAEGDFTIKATFSEDATGALADSVNFIAQQLGARIQAMTTAVAPMPHQAEEALQMVSRLSEVNQYQVQELESAQTKFQQIGALMERMLVIFSDLTGPGPDRPAALETARECAELAADLAAMIETVLSTSTQLADEAGQSTQSLEALMQSVLPLRRAADSFILPP